MPYRIDKYFIYPRGEIPIWRKRKNRLTSRFGAWPAIIIELDQKMVLYWINNVGLGSEWFGILDIWRCVLQTWANFTLALSCLINLYCNMFFCLLPLPVLHLKGSPGKSKNYLINQTVEKRRMCAVGKKDSTGCDSPTYRVLPRCLCHRSGGSGGGFR